MGCPGNATPWTPEEDARLKELRLEGMGPQQIARFIGRAQSSVRTRLAALEKSKERPCMCCGKKFASEGPHNRLCTTCRNKSFSPYAY
ncbi:MAG: hypothetical protein ABTQ26_08800 [Azonexus sp.]